MKVTTTRMTLTWTSVALNSRSTYCCMLYSATGSMSSWSSCMLLSSGQYLAQRSRPTFVSMTMMDALCSQTILQKSSTVFSSGPCVAMYALSFLKHMLCTICATKRRPVSSVYAPVSVDPGGVDVVTTVYLRYLAEHHPVGVEWNDFRSPVLGLIQQQATGYAPSIR